MDDFAARIIDRENQLAEFDHARDDFENALSSVPEEALSYRPEGEDYSLRDLVPHLGNTLLMYSNVLDRIQQAEYQEVRLVAAPDEAQATRRRIDERASTPLRTDAQMGTLDELEGLHDKLAGRLRDMAEEEYGLQAPVYYAGSEEPYPTAASDIIGWVTDHYREHARQVLDLQNKWSKSRGAQK